MHVGLFNSHIYNMNYYIVDIHQLGGMTYPGNINDSTKHTHSKIIKRLWVILLKLFLNNVLSLKLYTPFSIVKIKSNL